MPSISFYHELSNFSGSGSGSSIGPGSGSGSGYDISGSYIDEFVYNDGNSDDDDYESIDNSLLFWITNVSILSRLINCLFL